jgi:hypothetical protein
MENGPFIDGLPIKNGDFPGRYVKKPDGKGHSHLLAPGCSAPTCIAVGGG